MSELPSIAVVIPVKNGFPEIRDCIEGLLRQTVRVKRILVIDSGSSDGTLDYLETVNEVEIIRIDPGAFNHGDTRNLGWQNATEDYLFYTVQDARPVNDHLLEELLKGFTDADVAGVCGQQVISHDPKNNPVEWFRPVSDPLNMRYQYASAAEFDALAPEKKTSVCSWDDVVALYRRSVLEQIPFQRIVFGEDMLWAKEALRAGYAIAYRQAGRVNHYHLENPDFTFRRTFTTLYFRYLHFGYIPPSPVLSIRRKISMVKILFQSLGFDLNAVSKWYSYNIKRTAAYAMSYTIFTESLEKGEVALEAAHQKFCGMPPVPPKNHENARAIG